MIVLLKLLAEIAEQHFVQMNCMAAAAADQVMMGRTLCRLIVWLFAGKVVFAYQAQLAQQFQRAIDG
jgi:hypothetical protein